MHNMLRENIKRMAKYQRRKDDSMQEFFFNQAVLMPFEINKSTDQIAQENS